MIIPNSFNMRDIESIIDEIVGENKIRMDHESYMRIYGFVESQIRRIAKQILANKGNKKDQTHLLELYTERLHDMHKEHNMSKRARFSKESFDKEKEWVEFSP